MSLGVDAAQLVLDPGIGFGKTWEQNLELIRRLGELGRLGRPLLLGASRKSFLGGRAAGAPPDRRLGGSLAAVAWAARQGRRDRPRARRGGDGAVPRRLVRRRRARPCADGGTG